MTEVEYLKIWNGSLGSVDSRDLSAENVLIVTDSKADCFVRVNNVLDCTIRGYGNVYYFGKPSVLIVNDTISTFVPMFIWIVNDWIFSQISRMRFSSTLLST